MNKNAIYAYGDKIMAWITVHQVTSAQNTGAYLNVEERDGMVEVWTNIYQHPTYLLQNHNYSRFIQFDNDECADSWFSENDCSDYKIIKLEEVK
jgi:hypothetical protein